jgi:hypothetical protein
MLALALATLDTPGLGRLLERNPERLRLNLERRSIQVLGCGGRISMSILLNDDQADPFTRGE